MKTIKLTKEEKDVSMADEKGLLKQVGNLGVLKEKYTQIAKKSLKKDKSITIRLAERDILHIKAEALAVGVPYQTLITSIIHQRLSSGNSRL